MGPPITQTRAIAGIKAVRLKTAGTLQIRTAPTTSLTIEAPPEVLPLLTSDVIDGTLELSTKDGASMWGVKYFGYRLTVPTLDRIDLDSTGAITFPDLVTTTMRTTINGSGTVTLGGTADAQEVAVPGKGIYAGDRLTSKTAKATISGTGVVNLNVSDSLDATVSGTGTIRYQGNPKVTKQISGKGTVMPK